MLLCTGYFSSLTDYKKYMYSHLHSNSKKWAFYSVNILKCECFLITCVEILKKWTFLMSKNSKKIGLTR